MDQTVILRYLGDSRHPKRRGVIPGVTPRADDNIGLAPGEAVEITDELLGRLNRPTGPQAREDFATMLAGIYNANYPAPRWQATITVIQDPEPLAPLFTFQRAAGNGDFGQVQRDVQSYEPLAGSAPSDPADVETVESADDASASMAKEQD